MSKLWGERSDAEGDLEDALGQVEAISRFVVPGEIRRGWRTFLTFKIYHTFMFEFIQIKEKSAEPKTERTDGSIIHQQRGALLLFILYI